MLGHLGVNVPDLGRAKEYYDQVMPLLDYEPFLTAKDEFAYMPANAKRGVYVFFYPEEVPGGYSCQSTGLQHLGFIVPTRTAIHAVHQRVVALDSEVLYAPREFPEYPPPYFATFWLDPFGFMLEAVCHHDRD